MTDENTDDTYYVAELVQDAQESDDVELSAEEREKVAELQSIYREVNLQDFVPDEYDVSTMPDELRKQYEVALAEFMRREGEMTDEDYEELEQFYGLNEGGIAELKERDFDE